MSSEDRRMFGLPLWFLDGVANAITIVGALSVVFAVYQYIASQEAGRAKETLNMIEIWETRSYSKSFDRLRDDLLKFWEEVPAQDVELAKTNARAATNLRKAMVSRVLSSEQATEDFDKVVYFFNRLGLCIEAKLCSKRTATVFFDEPFQAFMSNFSPVVSSRRDDLPGYANGLVLLKDVFEN